MERNDRAVDIEAHNADGPVGGFRDEGGVITPTDGTPVRETQPVDQARADTAALVADVFNSLHRRIATIERERGIEHPDRDKDAIIVSTARGDIERDGESR